MSKLKEFFENLRLLKRNKLIKVYNVYSNFGEYGSSVEKIKNLLKKLSKELKKHKYKQDETYVPHGSREFLRTELFLKVQTQEPNEQIKLRIIETCLNNIRMFIFDEINFSLMDAMKANLTYEEMIKKEEIYKNKGFICEQEKNDLLSMIDTLMGYLN